MNVHLALLSIIIIPHVKYTSITVITEAQIFIFYGGTEVFLDSNTINENLIPLLRFCHSSTSHWRLMVVASLLWITFVDKITGWVHSVADVGPE